MAHEHHHYTHYAIIYPSESLEGQPGWTAKSYDPIRKEWFEIGAWYPSQQEALDEAEARFRESIREDEVARTFKPVIDGLKRSGFSLAEILNGLAELADRDSYPDRVGYFLEEAAAKAVEKE